MLKMMGSKLLWLPVAWLSDRTAICAACPVIVSRAQVFVANPKKTALRPLIIITASKIVRGLHYKVNRGRQTVLRMCFHKPVIWQRSAGWVSLPNRKLWVWGKVAKRSWAGQLDHVQWGSIFVLDNAPNDPSIMSRRRVFSLPLKHHAWAVKQLVAT